MCIRDRGPFTGRQLTTIILGVVLAVAFPVGAWAVTGTNAFITDAASGQHAMVDSGGNLHTSIASVNAIPPNQFSVPATYVNNTFSGLPIAADAVGTRYAISSFTVTSGFAATVQLFAISVTRTTKTVQTCANYPAVNASAGPMIAVAAGATVELNFPQPFVIPAAAGGTGECLVARSNSSSLISTWSAIGYRL